LRLTRFVLLRVRDLGICLVAGQDLGEIGRRNLDDVKPKRRDLGDLDAAVAGDDLGLLIERQSPDQLDEQGGG